MINNDIDTKKLERDKERKDLKDGIGALDLHQLRDHPEVIVMDDLRLEYPEKFNESGQMDYKWFEEDIRPNYGVFIRIDKNSITFNTALVSKRQIKEIVREL